MSGCVPCEVCGGSQTRGWHKHASPARTFTGTTHDGTPVVVTVHDAEGVADLAFADATGRFGPAVELSEEQA